MMGVVSQGPVYYDLFEEFADLSTKGMGPLGAPDERGHRDGWGLACFLNGDLRFYERDVGSAADSPKYYGVAWRIAKLNIERDSGQRLIVLGHLRRASDRTSVAQQWSQPFVESRNGVTWAFQHNGSLVQDTSVQGRTDSQVLFGLLLEALDGRAHEAVGEATRVARQVAIDRYGGFTALNFLLTDGTALHAYRDFQTNGQYYTLLVDSFGELIVAASEPLLGMKEEPLPRGMLTTVGDDLALKRTAIA